METWGSICAYGMPPKLAATIAKTGVRIMVRQPMKVCPAAPALQRTNAGLTHLRLAATIAKSSSNSRAPQSVRKKVRQPMRVCPAAKPA